MQSLPNDSVAAAGHLSMPSMLLRDSNFFGNAIATSGPQVTMCRILPLFLVKISVLFYVYHN